MNNIIYSQNKITSKVIPNTMCGKEKKESDQREIPNESVMFVASILAGLALGCMAAKQLSVLIIYQLFYVSPSAVFQSAVYELKSSAARSWHLNSS